jgi:predicted alpha/beta-hydrolase family hydrolase
MLDNMTLGTSGDAILGRSFGEPAVRGYLHRPANPSGDGLVLTHGASSDCNAPLLRSLAEIFAENGLFILRCDLPFRQERPHGPPRPRAAERDRLGLQHAALFLRKHAAARRLFLGGQSYGGRQASTLAAEQPELAHGLLLLSYPLHPPGKAAQLRVQHFPALRTKTLFVSGTHDSFGSIEELQTARKLISAETSLMPVEGVGHDLGSRRGKTSELAQTIWKEFQKFFGE